MRNWAAANLSKIKGASHLFIARAGVKIAKFGLTQAEHTMQLTKVILFYLLDVSALRHSQASIENMSAFCATETNPIIEGPTLFIIRRERNSYVIRIFPWQRTRSAKQKMRTSLGRFSDSQVCIWQRNGPSNDFTAADEQA